ncbi:hypothetical protein AVEN_263950-1 [Araneus ventricosus]|uniref:Uncharacterized protein n=1 Tax=Araneus ventricosus TaxID=182803 RepID=A0A4Y2HP29_ARAVE|nr:hypothetical protein AVEN_263950-1 [Araneus ventricosus]
MRRRALKGVTDGFAQECGKASHYSFLPRMRLSGLQKWVHITPPINPLLSKIVQKGQSSDIETEGRRQSCNVTSLCYSTKDVQKIVRL